MEVVITIIPIFAIIFLGWGSRKMGFITPEFLEPANRLVYYLSIPALVFSSIARVPFHERFDGTVLAVTLVSVTIVYALALFLAGIFRMTPARAGVFVQSSGHGNVGYIGLPTAYYYLGNDGLATVGIICGFLMVVQNLLSILVLQMHDHSDTRIHGVKPVIMKLLGNPVIIGAMAGILVSAAGIAIPAVFNRTLDILGGLAPPMSLLLIGASLSIRLMRRHLRPAMGAVALKLLVLPALAVAVFMILHVETTVFLPALILLCSPTATIVYVMAHGMHGDTDFAVASISASTLISSITFIAWLSVIPRLTG